jgi:hypothetical protein
MIYFSRITYLAKLEMLKSFSESLIDAGLTQARGLDFFFLGVPHSDPVTPSGTVGMAVSEALITKNLEKIAWGFFGDSGSILSGRRLDVSRECAYRARIPATDLLEIMETLKSMPRQRMSAILRGAPDLQFLDSVSHLLDLELLESTRKSSTALDWRIEVALNQNYTISEEDVLALAVPNTYRMEPSVLRSIKAISGRKVVFYNPKTDSPHKCITKLL